MSIPVKSRQSRTKPLPVSKRVASGLPAKADYSDEVTEQHLAAIRSAVGDVDWSEMETISGPAW